jgi:hypothetical protein
VVIALSSLLILFSIGDVACYCLSDHPGLFPGWFIPGSGYYALWRWGRR